MKANPYDFWKWAYSDFLSNAHRGVLAEYIVDMATGVTHRPRVQWDDYDLETKSGLRVEVKSAAFLQSWAQERPSVIRFDIAQRSGRRLSRPASALRAADVYVRATCMNVITRKDDAGFLRAYLVLQDPKSVPTRDGYDSIASLASDGEYFLLGIDSSIRLSRRST